MSAPKLPESTNSALKQKLSQLIKPLYRVAPSFLMASLVLTSPLTSALGDTSYITHTPENGGVPLVSKHETAAIYADGEDFAGIHHALADLQTDVERVTGKKPPLTQKREDLKGHAVIVGSLGKSPTIDHLIESGKIDASGIEGVWEGYIIQTVKNPLPGLDAALVIVGSDKRGAIFGVYDVSEQIGVSPWHWWADVPPAQHKELYIKKNTQLQDSPEVKYRGIFLNDEAPALTNWVLENYGNYNHHFYEHVFELLLRLKANFLWPAMWNNAFADDDPQNMILADEYGVVMSTSHHEPMMRADKEWNRYGEGPWDYARNPEKLYEFWVDGVERNKNYESIYTVGMRGQEDTPMSESEDIDLLERIVRDQRQILSDAFDGKVTEVPQVWALYKEVQGYYESGMRVPDDVTLLWADDNWGNIRRLPTPEERDRKGGAGVYYHFDYVGGPRSYRWINVTPIAKIWEQMNLAYEYEATRIWITNVGDLKPMEFPTEFFLRMAWDPNDWPKERLEEFGRLWAEREFGPAHAEDIAGLMSAYTRHNARRKPELQNAETYSVLNYREAERIERELKDMIEKAEAIYQKIPEQRKDAYYQLVLHPVKASANVTLMYINAARNRLYAKQHRATTNQWAQKVKERFELDAHLEDYFHTELSDGKWNHMMSQPHIGYTHWNNPPADTMPYLAIYEPHGEAEMGVAVEGMTAAWPEEGASYQLDTFTPFGQPNRRLEVYNRGSKPFDFEAKPSHDWIQVSTTHGTVKESQTVDVSVDWDKAPEGEHEGNVHVTGTGWGGAKVVVSIDKPNAELLKTAQGFVEGDGYVAIEAAHYSDKQAADGVAWEEVPLHGRTLSSMSTFPITDKSFKSPKKAPYLEYDVYFFSTGEFELTGYFAPTLKISPKRGLRYAVSLGSEKPKVVDILENFNWDESVRNGVHTQTTRHTIKKPGLHKLIIYRIDPAVTLQRLVVDTGGLEPSYLGPPESERL